MPEMTYREAVRDTLAAAIGLVPVVRADTGAMIEAVTYVALLVGDELRPTRAYLGHLLAGRDLLPDDYCARLGATPTID